jgi:glycine oxidase
MGQAWRAAGGMLAPQIEADAKDPLLEMGLAARDYYKSLAGKLLETTGKDIGLWQEGIARVAVSETEAAELRARVKWQEEQGYVTEWLDGEDVRARWPWLGPTTGALWAGGDGALDPLMLVHALLEDAEQHGAAITTDRALRVDHSGDRVSGVTGASGRHFAPDVVVAAGAWSALLEGLPRSLAVEPVRGQMAALPWPASVPRTIVYNKDCYLLARAGEAILGSTMEHVGFQPEVTQAGLARIFAATMLLYPGLMRAKVQRTWAGLRPMTPDGLPIIGREPLLNGLWYATGHGRNGILLAGLTGVLLQQLMSGQRPVIDVRPFRADRPALQQHSD